MSDRVWSDLDYDSMSWHDVIVHGLRLIEGEHGCGELVLDIDYILEWIKVDHHFDLRRQPATLTFHGVSGLRMSLDYAACSAGLTPFSIDGIERRAEPRRGYVATLWQLPVNWPVGELTFEALGFEQRARGASCVSSAGALTPKERGDETPNNGPEPIR